LVVSRAAFDAAVFEKGMKIVYLFKILINSQKNLLNRQSATYV
jgi:hypothetical protein